MDFKVGDKVKAIDFSGTSGKYLDSDKIYTIKEIDNDPPALLYFENIQSHGFYAYRFIKINEDGKKNYKYLFENA